MFVPQLLHLHNGKETLSRLISVETSYGGKFTVRVTNHREYPINYRGPKPHCAGNSETHFLDTEQEADDRAAQFVTESLAQGYLLMMN